jgi:hypothetical protein
MPMATLEEFVIYFYEKLGRTGSLDEAFRKATWNAFRVGYNKGLDDGLMGSGKRFNFERRAGENLNKKT